MDEPLTIVETKRTRRIPLPNKTHLKKAGALTGAALLGGAVVYRKMRGECACDNETENSDTTSDS